MTILLYDGYCGLCGRVVRWIEKYDREHRINLVPLQSEQGAMLLSSAALEKTFVDSVVLVAGEKVYLRSDAIIKIGSQLGGLWRAFELLRVLPRPLRDWGYNLVAANRYKFFGKYEQCMLPTRRPPEN